MQPVLILLFCAPGASSKHLLEDRQLTTGNRSGFPAWITRCVSSREKEINDFEIPA